MPDEFMCLDGNCLSTDDLVQLGIGRYKIKVLIGQLVECCFNTKQWPLTPNSRDSLNTRANLARRVTFFSKMAFGECWRVWRVRAKQVGECRQVWQVRANQVGECRRVWRVRHISEKGHFGEYSNLPKMANFWRVLKFAKFAGEWPLLI